MIENTKKKESWMIDYKAVVGSICTGATGARSYIFTSPGILCYFVTLLFCPLHQSGKDLSLLLKLSKVGALTTADGKSFQ